MNTQTLPDHQSAVFNGGLAGEQYHPGQFNPAGVWGESPALKQMSQVTKEGWEKHNALHAYRVEGDPRLEAAVHAEKLGRLVDDASRNWTAQFQSAKDGLKAEHARLESELIRKANLKANPDYRNAILGVFSGLDTNEKMAAIEDALASNDGPTLQALIEAPSLVSGLTAEQRASIKEHAFERADPNAHALLKELSKAMLKAEAASVAYINNSLALLKSTNRYKAKVAQAEALEAKVRSGVAA